MMRISKHSNSVSRGRRSRSTTKRSRSRSSGSYRSSRSTNTRTARDVSTRSRSSSSRRVSFSRAATEKASPKKHIQKRQSIIKATSSNKEENVVRNHGPMTRSQAKLRVSLGLPGLVEESLPSRRLSSARGSSKHLKKVDDRQATPAGKKMAAATKKRHAKKGKSRSRSRSSSRSGSSLRGPSKRGASRVRQ